MSARDAASGSSTFHGGGKYSRNGLPAGVGTGQNLGDLLAEAFKVSLAPQTSQAALTAPPMPHMRPQQATAPGKGSIPGAGNPVAPAPQVSAPGKGSIPEGIPPQTPGGYPQMISPNLGPFGPPGYTPSSGGSNLLPLPLQWLLNGGR